MRIDKALLFGVLWPSVFTSFGFYFGRLTYKADSPITRHQRVEVKAAEKESAPVEKLSEPAAKGDGRPSTEMVGRDVAQRAFEYFSENDDAEVGSGRYTGSQEFIRDLMVQLETECHDRGMIPDFKLNEDGTELTLRIGRGYVKSEYNETFTIVDPTIETIIDYFQKFPDKTEVFVGTGISGRSALDFLKDLRAKLEERGLFLDMEYSTEKSTFDVVHSRTLRIENQ